MSSNHSQITLRPTLLCPSHDGGLTLIGDIFGYLGNNIEESFNFLLFRFKRWGLLIEGLTFEISLMVGVGGSNSFNNTH